MQVSKSEIIRLLQDAASQFVTREEAEYFAEETYETHIRKSPRSNPIKSAISDLYASFKHKNNSIIRSVDKPSYVAFDLQGHGPLVYLKQIHDLLEKRSQTNGIAMISFTNGQTMHTLHAWVQGLAKRGLVAIALCNGGPAGVVPFNGTRGIFGTNPIAFGIPGEDGENYCVDMATSEMPFFELIDRHSQEKTLPLGVAVDAMGEETQDPKQALDFSLSAVDPVSNLLPIGGSYKGYYLVFLLEVLTSAIIGAASSPEMHHGYIPEEHGACVLVFNPTAMHGSSRFVHSISALKDAVLQQTPKSGTTIQFPGLRNYQKIVVNQDTDVELADSVWKKLQDMVA